MSDWQIFKGNHESHKVEKWPSPPPWRNFNQQGEQKSATQTFQTNKRVVDAVNMAIYLRRPLLVTGKPGTGKSSLAKAIASELELGKMLHWPINTRSTLQEGLYYYDAIARLQDAQLNQGKGVKFSIGDYIRLGALGTAICSKGQPRVLLIDEIDKSDIDLPNDLLNIFEEGYFVIEELQRLKKNKEYQKVTVRTYDDEEYEVENGRITCEHFPIIIMTSNGEREFPIPFKRRCIQLEIQEPDPTELTNIVKAHLDLGDNLTKDIEDTIKEFVEKRRKGQGILATDQLLNVVFMFINKPALDDPEEEAKEKEAIKKRLIAYLNTTGDK